VLTRVEEETRRDAREKKKRLRSGRLTAAVDIDLLQLPHPVCLSYHLCQKFKPQKANPCRISKKFFLSSILSICDAKQTQGLSSIYCK